MCIHTQTVYAHKFWYTEMKEQKILWNLKNKLKITPGSSYVLFSLDFFKSNNNIRSFPLNIYSFIL